MYVTMKPYAANSGKLVRTFELPARQAPRSTTTNEQGDEQKTVTTIVGKFTKSDAKELLKRYVLACKHQQRSFRSPVRQGDMIEVGFAKYLIEHLRNNGMLKDAAIKAATAQ